MTLIIAGFNRSIDDYDLAFGNKKSPVKIIGGLFAAADSAITNNGKTILNGFRKLHTVEARLFTPYFKGYGAFSGEYLQVIERTELLIGFAGSSLIAQHMLNGLTKHLGNLHLSLDPESFNYRVYRDCDRTNPLLNQIERERHDICEKFPPDPLIKHLKHEVLKEVILHSLDKSLATAAQYQLGEDDFLRINTEMFSGYFCGVSGDYHLLSHKMVLQDSLDSGALISFHTAEVPAAEILVLGSKEKFQEPATQLYSELINDDKNIPKAFFDFLSECIGSENSEGNYRIAKPAVLRTLVEGRITRDI